MPGYYVHIAASNQKARQNRSFVYGVEMPDLLKTHLKLYGLEGTKEKYNSIKTKDMPDFSYFESRVQQQENNLNNNGMHYGYSSNPNIMCYWDSLTKNEKQNPFYIGYLWHLLTDLIIYKYLNIENQLSMFVKQHEGDENIKELIEIEKKKLHNDWDKTNAKIKSTYPDVILTPEIIELNIIKFINDNQTYYIDWNIIKTIIDYMRSINPLTQDINRIIDEIMFLLPEQNDSNIVTLNKKLALKQQI